MLTILEILIIAANIPVLLWALLPVKRVPRFVDFLPLTSVIFLVLHLLIDNEPARLRLFPIYIFTVTMFLITFVRIYRHNPNQPKRRVLAAINHIFSLVLLAVCVLVPTVLLPFKSLPEPTGKFNVSTVVCDFIDNNRVETLSKKAGMPRKIAVEFWYPTDRLGPEISSSQQSYPVLIFSHGAFGMRKSNASTFMELASHGYIVASIDHTYHSFYTTFSEGRGALINNKFLNEAIGAQLGDLSPEEEFELSHDWLKLRTGDINFVIDSLKSGKLDAEGELLNGHIDMTKIGLFGHSLGGAAAAQVSRERDDVTAVIVIDGTMIGDIVGLNGDNTAKINNESFSKPLMLMYGSLFEKQEAKETSYLPNINAFNNATNAAYSVCIKNSGHLNFTDLPRISPFLAKKLGIGTIDSLECIKIVNDYCLAFFDKHVKGQTSFILDSTTVNDKVIFDKK
jgi:dienelactone hydrolase